MSVEYNTLTMYKVYSHKGIALFESKETAEQYVEFLKTSGETFCGLNAWSWEVKIEK